MLVCEASRDVEIQLIRIASESLTSFVMDAIALMLLYWMRRRRQNCRRYWVHNIYQRRETYGEFHHLMDEILNDETKCLAYIRMKPARMRAFSVTYSVWFRKFMPTVLFKT